MKVALCIHPSVEHYTTVKMAIEEAGDTVGVYSSKITLDELQNDDIDFIVSYGYKYLIKGDLLDRFQGRIINLHPSLLPWGRGYFPNFWSHVYDFPKGVSIHLINSGIDTGDLLLQREHSFSDNDTLRTSYYTLQTSMLCLFSRGWNEIRKSSIKPMKQVLKDGSLFYKRHFDLVFPLLNKGFDTSLVDIHQKREEIIGLLEKNNYKLGGPLVY